MAIYSLHHAAIGRTTHRAGTAGAHAEYVTRAKACSAALAENMPAPTIGAKGGEVRAWLDAQEEADRKNARVVDKLTLALPVELNAEGRAALVRDFAHRLGGGRVPWLAGIHDRGKDENNPHAHFVVRDRDRDTGKRVVGLSEKGSTERVRLLWEEAANDALAAMGSAARIDRRSLLAQGAGRDPGQHQGPAAQQIVAKGGRSTKLKRIEKGMKPRRKAMKAARQDRSAREAREAKATANEARRIAQEAARAEKKRRDEETAAERRRAALEARKAQEATQAAQKAEKALRDAQIAAERQERVRVEKIEAAIARSRGRVLHGRGLRNTVTGLFRHLRDGMAMLEPFSQDDLRTATRHVLLYAGVLRDAWAAFRKGQHDGDFREAERDFTEASTDLHAMHMVPASPKRLTGAELEDEQGRMAELAAFPDQDLLRPAIGAAAGRAAEVARHIRTPKGQAKIAEHRRDEQARAEARQRAEEGRRLASQQREEQHQAWLKARRDLADETRPILARAAADPDAALILDRWVRRWRDFSVEVAATDDDWRRGPVGGYSALVNVRRELHALDERRRAAPPQPAPRLDPKHDPSTERSASQPDPEPKPQAPAPDSGWGGPRM